MTTAVIREPLERARTTAIAGVCAGLARHLGWPVVATRVVFVVLAFASGAGILFYAWLWALVPLERPKDADAGTRRQVVVAAVLAAIAALAALVVVSIRAAGVGDPTAALLLTGAAGVGAVTWNLTFDRSDASRTEKYGIVSRLVAAVSMFVAALAGFLRNTGTLDVVLAVALTVLGVAVVAAPTVVRLWTDLMAERATRVRQEHRAEIAAHLHDSVLQTLALIQNRAGASSEVARIARAQERELRDWLFAGDAPVAEDLATELRSVAASVELDYPVRIDVVAVGDTGAAHPALVGATREAMVNAARHAGGDVSVYVESTGDRLDVFVRDRGPGVDLDALPDDRLGIRESIIGRMTRAGGTATVEPGIAGVGTEVHLHLEAP